MTRRLDALELRGERVALRLHQPADAAAAFALLAGREEILRWLVWDGPLDEEELANHFRHPASTSGTSPYLRLAIVALDGGARDRGARDRGARNGDELAGSLVLRFAGDSGPVDVGYWVGLPYQRRGFGTEALELAAHLVFTHFAAQALDARVFVGNSTSRRVLERVGFTLSHTGRGTLRKHGVDVDEWHLVLLADDWRRLRPGFRPRGETLSWSEGGERDWLEAAPPLPGF